MKFYTKLMVFAQIILLFTFVEAKSDGIDNAGREFYFAYMPNWHNKEKKADDLYVFISSKKPTKGKIEYTSRNGIKRSQNFVINTAGEIITFNFDPTDYELLGFNNSGQFLYLGGDCEQIVKTSFHLTSEDDVTVVIHNEANFTSDACLVYPADALGQNYFVFSYESNVTGVFGIPSSMNTPSQFVIVGTEDGTNVSITPTTRTWRYGTKVQNITLNKGEAYLVQAKVDDVTSSLGGFDLTGTRVVTDKPVAVFGGHQRANIPYTEVGSRDYLLSQMIPLESWGKDVFIVPFFQPGSIENIDDYDVTKITVAYDDTELSFGGQPFTTLNRGESITQDIIEPIYVTGDKPIRACLYKKSTKNPGSNSTTKSSSDPFMVLFPPKDQFLREYNFINVNLPQKYLEHYINIIIPTVSISSIRLDGSAINADFKPIDGIAYSYANVRVNAGSHNITADTNLGICVYGYGETNSYGYVGGLGLEVLDWNPPKYTSIDIDCFSKKVNYTEIHKDDSGLDSIVVLERINTELITTDSTKNSFSANVELLDKYKDGRLKFYAIDSAGSKSKSTIFIEGFTFTLSSDKSYKKVDLSDTLKINSFNCISVTITNYGMVRKDISKLKLKSGLEFTKSATPEFLNAGDSVTFQVCYQSTLDFGWHRDTLTFENDCFSEVMGTVNFYLAPDEDKPAVTSLGTDCGGALISANEGAVFDYGFGTYDKLNSENLDVILQKFSTSKIELALKLIDPFKDGFYEFKFIDQAGNDSTISGIVQGFTASFVKDEDDVAVSFTTQSIGNSKCLDILIENKGALPITLDNVSLSERLNFFIPQSQLPLTIQPDSVVPFKVCFYDAVPSQEMLEDELQMSFNCLSKKIKVDGQPKEIILGANSKCDYQLKFTFGEVPGSLTLENIYPNPTSDELNMRLLVEKTRPMLINLINMNGETFDVLSGNIDAGAYDLRIDVRDIPSGSYVLQIISGENRLSQKVLVNK